MMADRQSTSAIAIVPHHREFENDNARYLKWKPGIQPISNGPAQITQSGYCPPHIAERY